MPNQPKTKARGVRLPDSIWGPIVRIADEEEVTPSDIIRMRLETAEANADLPPHKCQHVLYRMTCKAYDNLVERAQGACELCGARSDRLGIDHDHSHGWAGVRGLLCPKCNAHIRRVDAGERSITPAVQAYLDGAWHLTHREPGEQV